MARFTAYIDYLKSQGCRPSTVFAAIVVNLVLFVAVRVALFAGCDMLAAVEVPGGFETLLREPWTLLLYCFVQVDFLHLFVNMLLLLFFGTMLGHRLGRPKWFWTLYFAGAVAGGLTYAAFAGAGSSLIGSSAAAMAIAGAATVADSRRTVNLFGLVSVRLLWVTLAIVAVDLLTLATPDGVAHASHIGGVVAGAAVGALILHTRRQSRQQRPAANHNDDIDVILHKLKTSGHASLTDSEKRRLFKLSTRKR